MSNNFNKKYDFELSYNKNNAILDKEYLEERQRLLNEINANIQIAENKVVLEEKVKVDNSSNVNVIVEVNEKYKNIVNKSPYHILASKLKCYSKLFKITYKNYYDDEFTTFRNATYTGFSMFIVSQIVINFTFTYHPLKQPLLWVFSLASIGLVFINWSKNIEELIALTEEKGFRKEIKNEIRDLKKDISLYNPFIKLNY
jgi:hypothetical protein